MSQTVTLDKWEFDRMEKSHKKFNETLDIERDRIVKRYEELYKEDVSLFILSHWLGWILAIIFLFIIIL